MTRRPTKAEEFRTRAGVIGQRSKASTSETERAGLEKKQVALKRMAASEELTQHRKQPDNATKALDRWNNEGGAPRSGDRSARKQPRRQRT